MPSFAPLLVFLAAFAFSVSTTCLQGQTPPTVTTIYSFVGNSDGSQPEAGLIQGSDGNFYGTTYYGGGGGKGTVFRLTPAGGLTTLYNFAGGSTDGAYPQAGVVQGRDGNFYGTASRGGSNDEGMVFRLTPAGGFTILHNFTEFETDGAYPHAGLVQGTDGNFYGTTSAGGINDSSSGAVFRITPAGVYTTLHSFMGTDGFDPEAALVQGRDGSFYGTVAEGGSSDEGTIFKITPAGVFSTLYNFADRDGGVPGAALIQGSDGNFYGTTSSGGSGAYGTVFQITPGGALTSLHGFTNNGKNGNRPVAALVQGSDGNFYGTTLDGGSKGVGTIFQITPDGVLTTLHSFLNADGSEPLAGLVIGRDGNFYGTTEFGGAHTAGAVFRLEVAPAISSASTATATVGKAFSYQIAATNDPTSFRAQGLPAGLTINASTGLVSGTPTAAGVANVTLEAANALGTGTAALALTVKPPTPVITSAATSTAKQGAPFTYQITASNHPASYGASGLPTGLSIDQTTGKISGASKLAGTFTVTIAAFNPGGSGSGKLGLTIKAAPPVITSATTASATVGKGFVYQIRATNDPSSFGVAGLPGGLTFDRSSGALTGTPTKVGTYTLTIAAFNNVGSGTAKLTLTVEVPPPAPVITSSLKPPSRQGVSFSYQITATNHPTNYVASGLPAGLSYNASTGKISGTPTRAGTYSVSLTVSNSGGFGEATLTLIVKPPA